VVKCYFIFHYFSPLNTFMRKGKDPELDPDPESDPDPQHWYIYYVYYFVKHFEVHFQFIRNKFY
jgi:hypothetical protein